MGSHEGASVESAFFVFPPVARFLWVSGRISRLRCQSTLIPFRDVLPMRIRRRGVETKLILEASSDAAKAPVPASATAPSAIHLQAASKMHI